MKNVIIITGSNLNESIAHLFLKDNLTFIDLSFNNIKDFKKIVVKAWSMKYLRSMNLKQSTYLGEYSESMYRNFKRERVKYLENPKSLDYLDISGHEPVISSIRSFILYDYRTCIFFR
jgi:Leucine-rich repeat (LRR) protein